MFPTLELAPPPNLCWNFKQSMGARNRVGKGLPYRPDGLATQPTQPGGIGPWNRILGSLKVKKNRALLLAAT
jgi:hypothetical protein